MVLQIYCSFCARGVEVPDDYLGAGVRCPHCAAVFAVQQTGVTATVPAGAGALPYEFVDVVSLPELTLPRAVRYRAGRGKLLLALGGASIGLAVLGLVANALALGAPVLFGPPAFGLGLTAWVLGQRDMEQLRRAVMDPDADPLTRLGWVSGIVGTLLAVVVTLCGFGGLYVLLLQARGSVH